MKKSPPGPSTRRLEHSTPSSASKVQRYALSYKKPLVIQISARAVRAGVAGETAPRKTLILEDDELRLQSFDNVADPVSENEWLDRMLWILRAIYFEKVLLRPRGRRVYMCVPFAGLPRKCEKAIVRALFEFFEVPSVHVAPSPGLLLLPTGKQAGITVDVGFAETRVVAVAHGAIVDSSFFSSPAGMGELLRSLRRSIAPKEVADALSIEALEMLARRHLGMHSSEASGRGLQSLLPVAASLMGPQQLSMRLSIAPTQFVMRYFFRHSAQALRTLTTKRASLTALLAALRCALGMLH